MLERCPDIYTFLAQKLSAVDAGTTAEFGLNWYISHAARINGKKVYKERLLLFNHEPGSLAEFPRPYLLFQHMVTSKTAVRQTVEEKLTISILLALIHHHHSLPIARKNDAYKAFGEIAPSESLFPSSSTSEVLLHFPAKRRRKERVYRTCTCCACHSVPWATNNKVRMINVRERFIPAIFSGS